MRRKSKPFSREAEASAAERDDTGTIMEQQNIDGPDIHATPINPTDVKPWEEISAGRFMPRRIRGSCIGRELG